MLFVLAGLAFVGLLFTSRIFFQQTKTRKFLSEIIANYSELRIDKKLDWEEATNQVITNRYNRAEDNRTLFHVKQLWNQKSEELEEASDEDVLRQLVSIISLVEKSTFAKVPEPDKIELFKKYYEALMVTNPKDDIEAA